MEHVSSNCTLILENNNRSINLLSNKVYSPPEEFEKFSHVSSLSHYTDVYNESITDPEAFWGKQAKSELVWNKPFSKTHEWNSPDAKWFIDGKLNVSYNCLDVHLQDKADKTAIIWEGEPGGPEEQRTLTYRELHKQTCEFANALKALGISKGDRVGIYMPMIPEAAVAMLACSRIGAIHSVVFSGFSSLSLADRMKDCQAKLVITCDGMYRRGSVLNLKEIVDSALEMGDKDGIKYVETVEKTIVFRRAHNEIEMTPERDIFWEDAIKLEQKSSDLEFFDSETPLFILYTSGSTSKPKGVIHSSAGYLLGAKLTHKYIFDIKDSDIYWCTADIGWITGHSYVVYGPLANGATIFMYEGSLDTPDFSRAWDMVERHKISILYTAPTAIRMFMSKGEEWVNRHDLSSLRLLGSVGEPISPSVWMWFHEHIGKAKCPIVDTWWQTETGSIMISPLPGAVPTKPGSATLPFFGVDAQVVSENGNKQKNCNLGKLVLRRPWPSMFRGIWNDRKRFLDYWNNGNNYYNTGDNAVLDESGYFWIPGRNDDVLNIAGHRVSTAEVESVLVKHDSVAEAAVTGKADPVKGNALVAFVKLMPNVDHCSGLEQTLRNYIGTELGAILKPERIVIVNDLPKTRSGKIMRRVLKQVANCKKIEGDFSTIENRKVLDELNALAM
ncbi:acetate--CoA ligase [Lentisphaerota bacterium]|nr:acetate--CoA ligase [Lentisphaerota bacterium]